MNSPPILLTFSMPVFLLSDDDLVFPDPSLAREDGILAIGGDLTAKRLLLAYQMGIFPWYNEGEPIIWWSPDPRFVVFPDKIRVTKSLRQVLRNGNFEVTYDTEFRKVITACQQNDRGRGHGTWITTDMLEAYCQLHDEGYAHSTEVWKDGQLVGGLYGISLGKCFFGESMFFKVSNASKVAFVSLAKNLEALGFWMIDCQQETGHLQRLGAECLPRLQFQEILRRNTKEQTIVGKWTDLFSVD